MIYNPAIESIERIKTQKSQLEEYRLTISHAHQNPLHCGQSLPFTVKGDFLAHYFYGLFAVPKRQYANHSPPQCGALREKPDVMRT